jgi:hypothetical protein
MSNPFAELELPEIAPRPVDFYEADEAEALYDAIETIAARSGGHWPSWAWMSACARVRSTGCTATASTGCGAS